MLPDKRMSPDTLPDVTGGSRFPAVPFSARSVSESKVQAAVVGCLSASGVHAKRQGGRGENSNQMNELRSTGRDRSAGIYWVYKDMCMSRSDVRRASGGRLTCINYLELSGDVNKCYH